MTTLSLFSLLEEEERSPAEPSGGQALTDDQRQAVDRREGSLFVQAGAGSGKTRVLVERFVRALLDDGVAAERMLAITFTEKAAAELRGRIRSRLLELGERDQARNLDHAWISTIHGFCSRLLRANALSAGVDPEFRVLTEHEAERLAAEALDAALDELLAGPGSGARVELVAAYGADRVASAIATLHGQLRGRGQRHPGLPAVKGPEQDRLRSAHARLGECVRAAQIALDGVSDPVASVRAAGACLDRCEQALDGLGPDAVLDPLELRALAVRRGNARALRGAVFDELEEVHAACLELCARDRAAGALTILDELLDRYGRRYAQARTAHSALDFDDLEILARDLLRDRPALRKRTRERFDHVLVDELQDTNALQSEIVDLVAGGSLFTVGDELQSIYGFRGADVGVFAQRSRAAAADGRSLRLGSNFRARAEILGVINAAFGPVLGAGFAPLSTSAVGGPDPHVELLAVDRDSGRWSDALGDEPEPFGSAMHGAPPWRAAEARLLARRVDELVSCGEFAPADAAILVRSWTDVDRYEQALCERGLPTYVAGGGGYWSAQQVGDLRAYLAVLANPRDEEALLAVLASPLAGVSLDALALLRLGAGRGRGLWSALEGAFGAQAEPRELVTALPELDAERLREFVLRLSSERDEVPRRSLPDLIERAVIASGYDREILTLPGGERRMANVRKLKRLAREFEAAEGRNLRGFLDEIARRGVASAREGEAPLEGEGIDAVRLMTIHAAKGLEFPLVCVADLGRGDPSEPSVVSVAADGRVGLRLPDPDGGALDALDARALAAEASQAGREEERRLLWVAATRAERRLVVSGALDLDRPREGNGAPAMEWLAPALVPDLREAHAAGRDGGLCTRTWEGRAAAVAWTVLAPANLDTTLPPTDRAPRGASTVAVAVPSAGAGPPADASPAVAEPPRAEPTARISYSALESYRQCGYRFYLERTLRLPPENEPPLSSPAVRTAASSSVDARTRGSVAHELLERLDSRRPLAPRPEQVAARLRARGAEASEAEVEELVGLIGGFLGSPLAERMKRARRVRLELPFAFALDQESAGGLLVEGVMDAYCSEREGVLVVDYKTDRVAAGVDLEKLCEDSYSTQRLVYALGALRSGAERVEVAHVFLERPHEPVMAAYSSSECARLELELGELVSDLAAGRHAPSPTPGPDLCRGCPGRAALCSWPPERTGARAA